MTRSDGSEKSTSIPKPSQSTYNAVAGVLKLLSAYYLVKQTARKDEHP